MSNKNQDDPSATYRGYRRQTLYCLFRLFDQGLPDDVVVQPEGNEDLALKTTADELLEAVQVKDFTANLTASSFKPSFYERISDLCKINPTASIKIVSFGPVGPELRRAYDNDEETPDRTLDTLSKARDEKGADGKVKTYPGLTAKDAHEVFKRIEIEEVNEAVLTQDVVEKLTATMTAGNPTVAFENLMWWLISSAEKQRRLTRTLTMDKIAKLGQFVALRDAHAHEWNISIKPIMAAEPDKKMRETLKDEFFKGGRVRAAHVVAGHDVRRDQSLDRIHGAFQNENVVVLRGASGQGKTTLAYRYLLDWAPSNFRFEVDTAENLEHARRMAAAVAGHTEAIEAPTVVYVDVRPGDSLWMEFVRALADVSGIRILVTIREEDWFRSRVSTDDFSFVDISMSFEEPSAHHIFSNLRDNGYGGDLLDFSDAWAKLGERKTLFEFVYLVTQNERLSQKVQAQIGVLKAEVNSGALAEHELHLLRLVAVASAYEARLDLKLLAKFVEVPEPTQTVQRFANEYLLRTSRDGKRVEGFHAIRSEIIAQELTDDVLLPRGEVESQLVPLLIEEDLESFLLCSFSRNPDQSSTMVESLRSMKPNSWLGIRSVLISLQWLGIKRYAAENMELIQSIRTLSSAAWWVTLDWDLARVKGSRGFDFFQALAKTSDEFARAAEFATSIQAKQSDKEHVFELALPWLTSFPMPSEPADNVRDLSALGEILFWHGHLNQNNERLLIWLEGSVVSEAWNVLPLHLFSRFAAGVQKFSSQFYERWLNNNRHDVESKIRSEARIILLAMEDDCLVAHFVIDLDRKASELKPSEHETSINDLAVQRVEIASMCLPGCASYGTSGYGHRLSLFESGSDESYKRMPVENITMPWLPEFNGLSRGVVEYDFRPETWEDFFARIKNVREKVVSTFESLRDVLLNRGKLSLLDTELWDECKAEVNEQLLLPKISVDEWGFVAESHSDRLTDGRNKRFSAISSFDPYRNAVNELTRTLGNFFNQSLSSLGLVPALRDATSETHRTAILEKAKEFDANEETVRLSAINAIDACIALRELHRIETAIIDDRWRPFDDAFRRKELTTYLSTTRSWAMFCYPDQLATNKRRQRQTSRRAQTLRDCLQATRNRVSNELKALKAEGIDARIVTEDVPWKGDSALWISFNVEHPMTSLTAIERMWYCLIDAFKPDRNKVVRTKAIEFYWAKIVLVPLVGGRSLERQALPNMSGVAYPLNHDLSAQLWRIFPDEIAWKTWERLGLDAWERKPSWDVFDRFSVAYSALFQHVDHMADIARCTVDLDEAGEQVLKDYIEVEQNRASPFLQDTFDSFAEVLRVSNALGDDELLDHPNLMSSVSVIMSMEDAISPRVRRERNTRMTLDEIVNWRNRLKEALNLLGSARYLWIADSLGFGEYDVV